MVSDECVRISQITMLCFCGCSVGKFPAAVWEEVIVDSLTHHDVCLRPLTHFVIAHTTHDVCLPSLYHSLAIALVIVLALSLSLTLLVLVLGHHHVFPRPLTHPLILLYLHSPTCSPAPYHQITLFVTARMADLALSLTHYSARDCTHHDHACRRPLTHSLYL